MKKILRTLLVVAVICLGVVFGASFISYAGIANAGKIEFTREQNEFRSHAVYVEAVKPYISTYKRNGEEVTTYGDDFAGVFLDGNGILNIGLVKMPRSLNSFDGRVVYRQDNYPYKYLKELQNKIAEIASDYGVYKISIDQEKNRVDICLTDSAMADKLHTLLRYESRFEEKAFTFDVGENGGIIQNATTAYGGESIFRRISEISVFPGTICVNAIDNATGRMGVLTNEHVALAVQGGAMYYGEHSTNGGPPFSSDVNIGTSLRGQQSGTIDAAFIPFANQNTWSYTKNAKFNTTVYNKVRLGSNQMIQGSASVVRIGQTTGVTSGSITSVDSYTTINGVTITNVFEYSNAGQNGDSGGPVYFNDGTNYYLIGMHYATSTDSNGITRGVACRIQNVMSALNVTPITNDSVEVNYNSNGGSGFISGQAGMANTGIVTRSATGYTRTNYYVEKWQTSPGTFTAGVGTSPAGTQYALGATCILPSSGAITLYAVWKPVTATITLDKQGGENGTSTVTAVYGNPMPSITAPERWGYTFDGYWSGTNGAGTKYYDAGGSSANNSTFTSNATLYAKWTPKTMDVNFYFRVGAYNSSQESVPTSVPSSIVLACGNPVTVTADNTGDYVFSHWELTLGYARSYAYINDNWSTSRTITADYIELRSICATTNFNNFYAIYTKKPASSGGSCIAEGTLITLADGTQVAVETLTGNELLLVWNLYTGAFDVAPILFVDSDPFRAYTIINLTFSDGTTLKVIDEHALWDNDLNRYVYIRSDASQYIGHWFNKGDGTTSTAVQLLSVDIREEYTTAWSPVTYGHLCFYVNGLLSMPGAVEGLINIFAVDALTMQYDEVAMLADIAEYGLLAYQDVAEIMPELVFDAFNGQYLLVSIGKGKITWDEIYALLERYAPFFEELELVA